MFEVAVARGADPHALAAGAGVELAQLEDPDSRVPLERYKALIKAGQALSGDPALALHYAEARTLDEVSIVGLIGNAAETMVDAFQQLQRYSMLVVEVDIGTDTRFKSSVDNSGIWLVDHRVRPNDFPELTETAFGQMVTGTKRFGDTPFVLEVHLTYPEPGYQSEYERVLGAPVHFEMARNAMRIDPAWMTHRIALSPRYVFGVLSERADALLEELASRDSVRARVEGLVMPILHTGGIGIDAVASKLNVSRTTLYRRLKEEGTTFEDVLDELRHRLAVDYLAGSKASVNETAYLVGFSEPAAFSRAFKRWTGRSPRQLCR
jgi:AraC-like DNA-binding protein